jgi:hypothetical protein
MKLFVKALSVLMTIMFLSTNAMAFSVIGDAIGASKETKDAFNAKYVATGKLTVENINDALNDIYGNPSNINPEGKAILAALLQTLAAKNKNLDAITAEDLTDLNLGAYQANVQGALNATAILTNLAQAVKVSNYIFADNLPKEQYEHDAGAIVLEYDVASKTTTSSTLKADVQKVFEDGVLGLAAQFPGVEKVLVVTKNMVNGGRVGNTLYVPYELFAVANKDTSIEGAGIALTVAAMLDMPITTISEGKKTTLGELEIDGQKVNDWIAKDPLGFSATLFKGFLGVEAVKGAITEEQKSNYIAWLNDVTPVKGMPEFMIQLNLLLSANGIYKAVQPAEETLVVLTDGIRKAFEDAGVLAAVTGLKMKNVRVVDAKDVTSAERGIVLSLEGEKGVENITKALNVTIAPDIIQMPEFKAGFMSILLALLAKAKTLDATENMPITNIDYFTSDVFLKSIEGLLGPALAKVMAVRMAEIAA